MLYTTPVKPGHWVVVPVIIPGVAGVAALTDTAKIFAALVPQELPAVTETLPFWPEVPVVTVMEFVPVPAVIAQPVGSVQV